jgi:hypothetical protein
VRDDIVAAEPRVCELMGAKQIGIAQLRADVVTMELW